MIKYERLLLEGIDHEITGTKIEKLIQVKNEFERAMIYRDREPSPEIVKEWLLGLPGIVYIPFENMDIIEWFSKQLKREPKTSYHPDGSIRNFEGHAWVERYWDQAALTLYHMLYD